MIGEGPIKQKQRERERQEDSIGYYYRSNDKGRDSKTKRDFPSTRRTPQREKTKAYRRECCVEVGLHAERTHTLTHDAHTYRFYDAAMIILFFFCFSSPVSISLIFSSQSGHATPQLQHTHQPAFAVVSAWMKGLL